MAVEAKMKIFQIGFNKCGTSTLWRFFEANGLSVIHWDEGRLARRMKENLEEGRYILAGYEEYDVFTDMESVTATEIVEGYRFFPQILDQVEGAKFILNTRDKAKWIASRCDFQSYLDRYLQFHGFEERAAVVELWSRDWDSHHAAVQALIPEDRLLIFDIETDSPLPLCRFAGLPESGAAHYALEHYTLSRVGELLVNGLPKPFKRLIPVRAKLFARRQLRRRRLPVWGSMTSKVRRGR